MAARKTINLLPNIFQTDTNEKFLSATLDQLISEPDLTKIYGYIGRKFAPTYKSGDSYVIESTVDRQNYQLEPSIQVRTDQDEITFFSSYVDYLNKIRYYGGLTNNHDRLFDNEYYSFDPHLSFDKLVNFSQYYWLTDGPDAVSVSSTGVELEKTYTVTRNLSTGKYEFRSAGVINNTLTLARGGVYTFEVDQPGNAFWIQSELGLDGLLNATPTISSRGVLGVENNGEDVGSITFTVPQATTQDRFTSMPLVYNVDYAAPFHVLPYNKLHNNLLSTFLDNYPEYAGITGQLDGKHLVFVNMDLAANAGEEAWTAPNVQIATATHTGGGNVGTSTITLSSTTDVSANLIVSGTGIPAGTTVVSVDSGNAAITVSANLTANATGTYTFTSSGYDAGTAAPQTDRFDVWKVQFIDIGVGSPLIRLVHEQDVAINEKVYIKYGVGNANKEYYKDYDGLFKQMPLLSSLQSKLYIQDGTRSDIQAEINIVEYNNWSIDVENDIIGKPNYTSPNGIEFTSGLKIQFDSDVTPIGYQNKTYYVEQVGDIGAAPNGGIRLVDVDLMVTPEPYNDENLLNYPDQVFPEYITINRSAKDLNAWSRNNKWFHRDVIIATAEYNETPIVLNQDLRARRPIVQFDTDLQLYNYGRIAKAPIDILDTTTLDAFNDLDGKVLATAFGITLVDGLRVLFAADSDPMVRDQIYVLSLVQYDLDDDLLPTGPKYIKLTVADDGDAEIFDSVVVLQGQYKGSQWWYDGVNWREAQQKTSIQQDPLFDVFDETGKSFSQYLRSTFAGTTVFGYIRNSAGTVDPVLGFPLSYRNFSTQGDIEFGNYFNTDTFTYVEDQKEFTVNVNQGYLQKIRGRTTLQPKNTWETVVEPTRQYQLITYVYDGFNSPFVLDVNPVIGGNVPYVKVYKNKKVVNSDRWTISNNSITLTTDPTVGDQIDILVYSKETSQLGYYQVPLNLDLNAQNTDISSLTLGQLRNHLVALDQNSTIVTGDILGISNLRDVDIKQQGGTILQHSAPIPYGQLFLTDNTVNFIDAQRFAQREYSKFKNKFLELSVSLSGIQPTDPAASIDLILSEINKLKNKTFPWFYSDMVPYGTLKNIIEYTIFDPLKVDYEITARFDDQKLSNQAVLIYLNGIQLIKDQDYVFRNDRPAVTIIAELAVDDILRIVEYQNTDGNYIPETPTKLGLWPKYTPKIFEDDTYRTPINVIQGHDGSITPAFGDYRDDILLELEKRIYNNLKLSELEAFSDIYSVVPGKFRRTDYSLTEINQLISASLLNWIGNNGLDISTNTTFESSEPFTWNYGSFIDRLGGEQLPGSWRACYQYFYDTFRPHIMPWEMLGFSEMPTWWEEFYGPAPYTGGNKLLWDDLEAGRIRHGSRSYVDAGLGAGIDPNYMRPGLSQVIPVDENGFLLSPAAIMTASFNASRAAGAWSVGQYGPVEFAWRMSSDFPFAIQQALALAKPAKYFGLMIDTYNYSYNYELGQYLTNDTHHHIKQTDITYNGDTSSGTLIRGAGWLNWIADYLTSQGINPSVKITPLIKKYQVNLAYKLAGFSDQSYLNILAEQNSPSSTNDSIILPTENYNIHLYKSTPVDKLVYSAVIVEKTNNGYTVRGYNLGNPYFIIIPSVVNGKAHRITVLNRTATIYHDYQQLKLTVPYGYEFTSLQQVVDFLISYERYLEAQGFTFIDIDEGLAETKNWTLSAKEFLFWAQQGWKAGSILVLSPVSNVLNAISIGAVTDGIDDSQYGPRIIDQNFKLIRNTEYNVVRNPTNFKVSLTNDASVVGFAEINLVQYEHVLIFDNTTVFNDIIYKPELGNRQYRLKLIGQKTLGWDGSLYAPGFVYNNGIVGDWITGQDYLKGDLVKYKNLYYTALENLVATSEFNFTTWKQIATSEIRSGLLPNFSTISAQSKFYYDSYPSINNKKQIDYSHGLIGFKPRQYLSDLGVNETTQIEFYKGFIKQKGSINAVNELLGAEFNNLTSNIALYEEWAMRVGEYGALDSNPYVEISLDETIFGVNPALAEFVSGSRINEGNGSTIFNASQLYKSTDQFSGNIALYRTPNSSYENDIPTAGYVNIDDVDTAIFDLANYTNLNNQINQMGSGYTIWCAKDFTQQWNVYRVTETDNTIISVSNSLDGYITFTSLDFHKLSVNDVFLLRSFDSAFDGFYQVYKVVDLNNVMVKYAGDTGPLTTLEGNGILFVLKSLRFQYMEDCREFGRPPHGWKVGEKVWINDDAETTIAQGQPYNTPNGTWKVYEKKEPWKVKQSLTKGQIEYTANDGYGTSVRMSPDELVAVVGNPQANVYTITTVGGTLTANVGDHITQISSGANLTVLTKIIDSISFKARYNNSSSADLIGNLYLNNIDAGIKVNEISLESGVVNTFLKNYSGEFVENFSIVPDGDQTEEFGYIVSLALDSHSNSILGVGAPGSRDNIGYVYTYSKPITSTAYNKTQILTGNLDLFVNLSSNITANVGEYIYQPTTGANLRVVGNITASSNVRVRSLNIGNLTVGAGNIQLNGANVSVYPTGKTNTVASGERFGTSLTFNQTGDWLYVGAPGTDSVYIYGLDRFVTEKQQITSVNDENIMVLSAPSAISVNDIIRQPSTGAEALVYWVSANSTIVNVSTLTNFLSSMDGNLTVGNTTVSANITIGTLGFANVYPTVFDNYSITSNIGLNFTPKVNDAASLLITDKDKTYIPNIDYIIDDNQIKFASLLSSGDFSITQQPYYALLDIVHGNVGSEFGYALSSSYDGAQLAVGAPSDNVDVIVIVSALGEIGSISGNGHVSNPWVATITGMDSTVDLEVGQNLTATDDTGALFGGSPTSAKISSINSRSSITYKVIGGTTPITGTVVDITTTTNNPGAGAVWVYDRVIEAFKSTGEQDYEVLHPLTQVYKVTIDEIEVNDYFLVSDNTIRFIDPPGVGKVIFVETNKFTLLEKLIGINSLEGGLAAIQPEARFGVSLTICSNNCAIYVGAPNYDAGTLYNTGAVWKFHSRGRLYGTNTGYEENPTFKPNDSIRLDNFEVRVNLGLSGNIRANVGEYITQTVSGANVTVLESTPAAGSNYIKISSYNNDNVFTLDSGNISVAGNLTSAYPRRTTLDEYISDINSAEILGVSAVNENGLFRLDSDRTVAKNLLRILSGTGTIFEDSQLAIFAFMQIIINPFETAGEYFGSKVKLAPNAYALVIGSGQGTTRFLTTFDSYAELLSDSQDRYGNPYVLDPDSTLQDTNTTFDLDVTRFFDAKSNSGSVYIYELYDDPRNAVEDPGRYQYAQQLNSEALDTGDLFGYAVDIENNFIMISAPADGTTAESAGSVYIFENPNRTRGWELIRYQQDTVDIDSINRIYLYSNLTNTILVNLQFIDPAKGKILGEAEQEITYKTGFDPALYNRGTDDNLNINNNIYWGDIQIGQVWWNLGAARFLDYEQDTLTYRSINWGGLFPGSTIEVLEWVESAVLPSQYVNSGYDGTPKYPDDSAYVEIIRVDPVTNIIGSVYYFWVTDKTTVDPNNESRSLPISTIKDYIENPKAQGIPYAAIIDNNAIILYNVGPYLASTNTILHIDYDLMINSQLIHSEYEIIQKGNPDNYIPNKIINKMIDSLSGIDAIGAVVPDPKLSLADRYGIGVRPRQSMFIDRLTAVNELVAFVNDILIKFPIARQYNLSQLNSAEVEPSFKLGEYHERIETDAYLAYIDTAVLSTGHRILVANDTTQSGLWVLYELSADKVWEIVKVQSYKTNLYWEYVDWYAEGYSSDEIIEYVVDTLVDAKKLAAAPGDEILVKVSKGSAGTGWNLLTVDDQGGFSVVGIENGTVQLSTALGDFANNELGFGNQGYSSNRYDQNPNIEIRWILKALHDNIFINTLSAEFNNMFFVLVNYLFTEQKYVDWIFKTSFVSVTHHLRTLSQFPSYIEDNQTYYQDYIGEVKPYRTKLREYLINYDGSDKFDGDITDFDLPPYYDTEMNIFRSPSGEEVEKDQALWQTDDYNQWYNSRTLAVDSIIVTNPGSGYATAPTVSILSSGGGGSGATAKAVIDGDTGSVIRIDLTNSGSGYIRTPTVVINGANTEPANGYAVLKNNKVRSFDTTIKFDRISYSTSVKEWTANTYYTVGNIITYAQLDGNTYIRKAYEVTSNAVSGNTFVASNYAPFYANAFSNANDRIIGYYQPGVGMPARDLNQLIYGVEYPGVQVQGLPFTQGPGFGGTAEMQLVLSNSVTVYRGNIITQQYSVNLGNITILANANITVANASISSNIIYGILNSTVDFALGNITLPSANIRINGSWVSSYPVATNYVSDTSALPFDNTPYDAVEYDEDGNPILSEKAIDTIIRSTYLDTALGTRPEDIDVDGGAYVDRYSSHAPEELIPGIVFDTLDMRVYTKINSNVDVLGYRIFNNMMRETSYLRLADDYSTKLVAALELTDTEIVVEDASVLPQPSPENSSPGVIFINNERITYYTINYGTNTLGQIRRGTHGTAARYHGYGSTVVDASLTQVIPGTVSGNLEITSSTSYSVSDKTTYTIALSGNISANVGDFITQLTSGTNVTVIGTSDSNTNKILVEYNGINNFNFTAANIGVTSNLAINGTYTGNIYPISSNIAGYNINSIGNVLISANATLRTANVWYNTGAGAATDGTGFEGATTEAVLFLKAAPATNTVISTVSDEITTEDAINTLTTETGTRIIEEDQ